MNVKFTTNLFKIICCALPFAGFGAVEEDDVVCNSPGSSAYNSFYCQCLRTQDQAICDDPRADPLFKEAISPTRLAFATFASQNGYLATAQVVTDHLYKKRFSPQKQNNREVAIADLPSQDLMADAADKTNSTTQPPSLCKQEGYFTGWLAPFGEYAHEKPQPKVPAFSFDVGGVTFGVDYNCVNDGVIGFGGSYVYTHVDEDSDAGHANVNQGFLGLYSNLCADKWYFDLAVWGGYYHTNNTRNNPFVTDSIVTTLSTTHGWQAAPHFEVGYDGYFAKACNVKWFGLEPFLLADWVANWEHAFSEHGEPGLNLHVRGKFCSLLRTETGLRFHEIVKFNWGDLVFQEKGSYAYQKMFHTGTLTSSLIGLPGTFSFTTLTGAQNLGVIEFSVFLKPSSRSVPYFDFRYQGEFGSKYQSHQGIVEIGKDF